MNLLLTTVLAVSAVIELAFGVTAITNPGFVASTGFGTAQTDLNVYVRLLVFVLGLVALGAAALHLLVIRWLRRDKREAYDLAIGLGGAILLVGGAGILYSQLAAGVHGGAVYLFLIDGIRGAFLGIAGFLALSAPATVRELRLPAQRDRGRAPRSDRDAIREPRRGGERDRRERGGRDREYGRGRDRDRDRDRGRRHQRGERDGRRSETGREMPGRPGREARPSAAPQRIGGEPVPETGAGGSPLKVRPLPGREESGEGRDRWRERRRRPPVQKPEPPEEIRSLGVVVTGTPPPSALGSRPPEGPRVQKPEAPPAPEERSQLPRAPMVPRVRMEIPPARPLRTDEPRHHEGERGEGGEDRRRRRRRRPSSPRPPETSGSDRSPMTEEAPEFEERPVVERGFSERPPIRETARPEVRPDERPEEPREERREERREEYAEEPIDMLSAFGGAREEDEEREPQAAPLGFGHHRRPFTQHRKGRQVKPREAKVRQSLGGDAPREGEESDAPAPPVPPTRRIAPEGQIGMTGGIGPIDLDEPDSDET